MIRVMLFLVGFNPLFVEAAILRKIRLKKIETIGMVSILSSLRQQF